MVHWYWLIVVGVLCLSVGPVLCIFLLGLVVAASRKYPRPARELDLTGSQKYRDHPASQEGKDLDGKQ